MGLRIITGRAGTGKTTACLEEIRALLAEDPGGPPLILLTPEQATFQMEYALLGGGAIASSLRAQVLSFRRLALRVMQESGGSALVPVGENGKNMLLHKIVHRFSSELQLFKGGTDQQGFITKLGELLTEWKRYRITAADVRERLEDEPESGPRSLLSRKLHDLSLIYGELEGELNGLYMDDEDHLLHLAAGFGECESLRGVRIWIDGFNGFTTNELAAIGALMRDAEQVTIALTLDRPYENGEKPHELELFHPTADTYMRLRSLAELLSVPVEAGITLPAEAPPRFRDGGMLAHLERSFGRWNPMLPLTEASHQGVVLTSAANRRAEVEAAAREMVRLTREQGARWREMAIIVRQTAQYGDAIQNIFSDYGIPFFMDQSKDALHHPLSEFIRSALETVLYGWKHEAVFRCVKTEMLFPDDSQDRERYDRLENYVLAAGIEGRQWKSPKSWRPLRIGGVEDEQVEADARRQQEFDDLLRARKELVSPLARLERALGKAVTIRGMCEALYDFLDRAGAASRLEARSEGDLRAGRPGQARVHRQLWDGVMNLLDQLVEMAGDEEVPTDLFAGMVETGLESLKLSSVPPSLDQAVVGTMDRTRTGGVRFSFVLGASDGVLPMRLKEDGVLTEREREQLGDRGLEMAPGVRRKLLDERFLVYRTFLSPSEQLWVSWPLADEEGKGLYPSEYIRHLRKLYPWLEVRSAGIQPEAIQAPTELLPYLELPQRTLSYLMPRIRHWMDGEPLPGLWRDVYNWFAVRPEWQPRLQGMMDSLHYENQEASLTRRTADRLYGTRLTASVTRMERFVSCPFQHFAVHGLKLRERKLYRLQAPDMGQLFHAALSRVALELGDGWGRASREEIQMLSGKVVEELSPRLQSEILLSSGRYRYIAGKLKDIVSRAAVVLGEHARRADFQPVGLEVDFGPGGTLPPLDIELPGGGSIRIIGRIDRVDAAQSDKGLLLRVLDYKSSATQLRLEEVSHGLSLQMLTYLDVLLTHAENWLGEKAHPAGVLYFHVHNPMISVPSGLEPDEAAAMLLKRFKMRGLLLDDADTVRMMDGAMEGRSDLLPAGFKKDGTFLSDSSLASGRQWELLRSSVRRTIGRIGQSVQDGEIAIRPYRLGSKTPCQFCSYRPVCQFDPLNEGNDYLKLGTPGKDEVWNSLEELAEAQSEPSSGEEKH